MQSPVQSGVQSLCPYVCRTVQNPTPPYHPERDSCRWYLPGNANLGNPRNPKIGYLENGTLHADLGVAATSLPARAVWVSRGAVKGKHANNPFWGYLRPVSCSARPRLECPKRGLWLAAIDVLLPRQAKGRQNADYPPPQGVQCGFGMHEAGF